MWMELKVKQLKLKSFEQVLSKFLLLHPPRRTQVIQNLGLGADITWGSFNTN